MRGNNKGGAGRIGAHRGRKPGLAFSGVHAWSCEIRCTDTYYKRRKSCPRACQPEKAARILMDRDGRLEGAGNCCCWIGVVHSKPLSSRQGKCAAALLARAHPCAPMPERFADGQGVAMAQPGRTTEADRGRPLRPRRPCRRGPGDTVLPHERHRPSPCSEPTRARACPEIQAKPGPRNGWRTNAGCSNAGLSGVAGFAKRKPA